MAALTYKALCLMEVKDKDPSMGSAEGARTTQRDARRSTQPPFLPQKDIMGLMTPLQAQLPSFHCVVFYVSYSLFCLIYPRC